MHADCADWLTVPPCVWLYRLPACPPACAQGFGRVKARLGEEALDFGPRAKDSFATYVDLATKEGWLVPEPQP